MARAAERFGADLLKPAALDISTVTMTPQKQTAAPAVDTALPIWLDRMFGRKSRSAPTARQPKPNAAPTAKTSRAQVAPMAIQAQQLQKPLGKASQNPQPTRAPVHRRRLRNDDRGRE
jgi:hypothetical protein